MFAVFIRVVILIIVFTLLTCKENYDKTGYTETLQKHLDAIKQKDIERLKETLIPENKFYLFLPGRQPDSSQASFLKIHADWFLDRSWTFDYKIIQSHIGTELGLSAVEIDYREAERNGQPYFNHMVITYALKKEKNQWYVFWDHATSIQKSVN